MKRCWRSINVPSAANGKVIDKVVFVKNKIKIIFKDANDLLISKETYIQFFLYPNKVLSNHEYCELIAYENINESRKYAFKIASNRLYSKKQMKDKLLKRGLFIHEADQIIKELQESNLLSDQEYMEETIREGKIKRYGLKRIQQRLKQVGIKEDQAVRENYTQDEEIENLNAAFEQAKIIYQNKNFVKQKESIFRFLKSRGFETEMINQIIENLKYDHQKEIEILKKEARSLFQTLKVRYNNEELMAILKKKTLARGYRYEDVKEVLEELYGEIY